MCVYGSVHVHERHILKVTQRYTSQNEYSGDGLEL